MLSKGIVDIEQAVVRYADERRNGPTKIVLPVRRQGRGDSSHLIFGSMRPRTSPSGRGNCQGFEEWGEVFGDDVMAANSSRDGIRMLESVRVVYDRQRSSV